MVKQFYSTHRWDPNGCYHLKLQWTRDNEGAPHIPQSSKTEALLSDCLVS